MLPHYLDHQKNKKFKYLDSNRYNRRHNCILKGQGKKPIRPKGGPTLSDICLALTLDILGLRLP